MSIAAERFAKLVICSKVAPGKFWTFEEDDCGVAFGRNFARVATLAL